VGVGAVGLESIPKELALLVGERQIGLVNNTVAERFDAVELLVDRERFKTCNALSSSG
jgi:hypothetical protein